MPTTQLQTAIVSLLTVVASIAVGFGAFGESTEQIIVASAGTLVAVVFQVLAGLHIIKLTTPQK